MLQQYFGRFFKAKPHICGYPLSRMLPLAWHARRDRTIPGAAIGWTAGAEIPGAIVP
jgi:hypothetical protein